MGRAGLQLLRRIVADKQVIGLAWGTLIRELTRHARNSKVPQIDADFVPLDGGRCHYIYATVITRTAEIRNAIVQDANYENFSDFRQKLDIALVGIGAPVKSSNLVWSGEFGRQAIESLSRTGTVGEICSVFCDKNGREVKTDFSVGVHRNISANKIFACGEPARKILCRILHRFSFRRRFLLFKGRVNSFVLIFGNKFKVGNVVVVVIEVAVMNFATVGNFAVVKTPNEAVKLD